MATSPRNELRIVSITDFTRTDSRHQWYWHTQSPNGKIVGDSSEGYKRLTAAVTGFFAQQGIDPTDATLSSPYSKLVKVNDDEYHIRKYAYGAPDPFDPNDPLALATKGWTPPHAQNQEEDNTDANS
jgi:hypothetical protein